MWILDWIYFVLCSGRYKRRGEPPPSLAASGNAAYAIRQRRRRLDGSGEYKVYVIDT